ncbi:kinesin-like protein KIF19 [Moschus berezovskii]|uniref:kinesin-like protein KIF19 n=1 Tax=Moschus berezovskii TaxID=68408 RepID=UPI002444A71B|nr:kinesin-like protein KIF19 [Moschus berezovskii]
MVKFPTNPERQNSAFGHLAIQNVLSANVTRQGRSGRGGGGGVAAPRRAALAGGSPAESRMRLLGPQWAGAWSPPGERPSREMVVLMDLMEDLDDILRAHRSWEKSFLFDVAFDFTVTQAAGKPPPCWAQTTSRASTFGPSVTTSVPSRRPATTWKTRCPCPTWRTPWGETAARDDRPASSAFEESRNTLTYAGRAKNIKTRVKQNLLSVSYHIAQYTNIIADFRGQIQRLRCKIEEQGGWSPNRAQLERGDRRHIQAEVQLHSGRGEQAAMEHLREQLISTFQEEMDIRRRLLELENRGMELQMDISRHLLTIASWKRKKSRQALKWREERRKESFTKDDTGKDLDTGDGQPDIKEPAEVVSARKSIATLMTEQKKLRKQKLALEQGCQELRGRGRRLEETLPRRVRSEEGREVLGLLCRVHELELRNAELQPHALLHAGALRDCREVLRHVEQHRSLCEEIIRAQRQLLQDCNLAVPQHLKELYEVYQREQEEGSLERATMMDRLASQALQDSTLPKFSPPGTVPTPEESDLENVKMPNSEFPQQHRSFLPLLSTESEANQLFKASSRAWQAKGSFVPTPPPIPASNLVTQEATTQVALNGQINSSPESIENLSEIPLTCKGKKETPTDTKGISVKAARYRLQALGARRQLLAPTMRHSSLSLYSLAHCQRGQPV